MQKKILIINGHPNRESFNFGIANAYQEAAAASGATVRTIHIIDLDFNPNLEFGYRKRTELEQDLLLAWEDILWADHLVWIHPVWWGGLPALMKGFIDRLFLPGRAFQYRENSLFWDKLLKGKSARIITTLDQPSWYYALVYGRPSVNQLKRSTLQFCGISSVKVTYIGIIKTSDPIKRNKWLQKVQRLGHKQA
ncbi:NAD(P)H-dependent oxidoreductase [Sphingobacterium multivorum]|uniref:NAD(P)H-dependent oxidoreductase n=1 Tax=Sphingobacterium multivorum TaxID=28454 RepID=UPI00191B1101|nr:NAD(P)H-dependent oxidoreductase [Sphingobacterium multivorum]QQT62777.1 NAD(P)H-dependent oxidoreductase [Sphingobacterium multivorum]